MGNIKVHKKLIILLLLILTIENSNRLNETEYNYAQDFVLLQENMENIREENIYYEKKTQETKYTEYDANKSTEDIHIEPIFFDITEFSGEQILDIKQRLMTLDIFLDFNENIDAEFLEEIQKIKLEDEFEFSVSENFISDISLNEFYAETDKNFADISFGYLTLTNKDLSLRYYHEPENLVVAKVLSNVDIYIEEETSRATELMFEQAQKDGITLVLMSGYREFLYQDTLLRRKAETVGIEEANRWVAIPGESEHQTGYVIDVSIQALGGKLLQEFDQTEAFRWLDENACDFGFILRYPEDKVEITKYAYEPWHYRYIGSPEIANFMKDENLTLEEYHEQYLS